MYGVDMKEKVVIVTGGGRGVGKGIATAFSREGANVVISGRTESVLLETKEELEKLYGGKVMARVSNISDEEQIKALVEETAGTFGKINALINNAQASFAGKGVEDFTNDEFCKGFNNGLFAYWKFMKHCFPYLKKTKGAVVNMGSHSGALGMSHFSPYNSQKEGVRGLSRTAANEWGKYGITVNVIHPLVETEKAKKMAKVYPELRAKILKDNPMGSYADGTNHVGSLCVYLCSDDGKGMTGQTLIVDCGMNVS
jgi:NAD(P)-dependent dehydrogenase (short-subunit alcohol dehydrogenase family)